MPRRPLLLLLLATIAMRAAAAASVELPSRLGELLRQLDCDQSRKLTRQIEPAQASFVGSDFASALASLKTDSAPAILVVGRRGPLSDSPVEISETFAIDAGALPQALGKLDAKVRARTAYVPRAAPDGGWSAMLASAGGESADPRRVSQALSAPGSAAFVFVMQPAQRVQKIIVVPDTVKITVSGDATASPPAPMRGRIVRPELPQTLPMPPPDYPMPQPVEPRDFPDPPEIPEMTDPPVDDSGE